jgi:starch synthase
MKNNFKPTIAILPWGNVFEDYLKQVGHTLETFSQEGVGGWLLGYIEALKLAGVQTTLFRISENAEGTKRIILNKTLTNTIIVPVPKIYSLISRKMSNPYGWTVKDTFGDFRGFRYHLYAILRDLAPYFANPLRILAREIRREGCSLILCQEYEYARFDMCVLLGWLLRIPVFATFQGGNFQISRLERPIRPFTINACSGLIVPTKDEENRLIRTYKLPSAKIARIFNPIDIRAWYEGDKIAARTKLGIPIGAKVVAWHGRIDIRNKGLDILLQAWEKICSHHGKMEPRLLIIGKGNDSNLLRELIKNMNLKGVIWTNEFITSRDKVRTYLNAADLYVFPSRHEGFPAALLEAMACGLPVIAADITGVSDILEGGESAGGIIAAKDDVSSFVNQISRLLTDEPLRVELGKRARRRIESSFSLEAIGKQLRNFIFKSNSYE